MKNNKGYGGGGGGGGFLGRKSLSALLNRTP